MVWNRLALPLGTLGWFLYSVAWFSYDSTLRDGDEDGHVGAAEIFRGILTEDGPLTYLNAIWLGDYGDYPNLFAGLLGFWWAIVDGQPEDLGFRIFPLCFVLLTALGVWLRLRHNPTAKLLGAAFVLLLPMGNGICRHAMPEGLVMCLLTLTMALGDMTIERTTHKRLIAFGLFVGLGALSKHNFIVLGLIPIVWFFWQLGRKSIIPIIIASFIAGPWYFTVGLSKAAYVQSTLTSSHLNWASLFAHPLGLVWDGLGPILAVGFLTAIRRKSLPERSKSIILWLLGGLAVLMLLPKQYPRLLLPILPAAICMIAVWLAQCTRLFQIIFVLLGMAWIHGGTVIQYPVSPLYKLGDDGCPQHWLRPPKAADFGLSLLTRQIIETNPTGVWLTSDLDVPCEIQTTHGLGYHLEYRLRRHGYSGVMTQTPPDHEGQWLKVSWANEEHPTGWTPQTELIQVTD